jgi:hypothetical protein
MPIAEIQESDPTHRLSLWRKFRDIDEHIDIEDLCTYVVEWWKHAPLIDNVIDPYDDAKWPTPWQLLYDGRFDENAVTLGMAYTFHLMGYDCKILTIQEVEKNFVGMVLTVDNCHVLSYTYGIVESIDVLDSVSIINTWKIDNCKIIKA